MQSSFTLEDCNESISTTLSWGVAEELLVANKDLTIYYTHDAPETIWTRQLANPAKFASFSYDSAYIVTTGQYDRLVKTWRRLSFGSDDTRFDFSYLPHPATVTSIHWRKPYHVEQTIENVLYTVCADNVLRIWAASDPHGLQVLQLWGQIDLQESIQPRPMQTLQPSTMRYAFMVDGRDFMLATEHAVQQKDIRSTSDHALPHLIEIARRSPEICVVFDDAGHMSAWGIENVGSKTRQSNNIFNITHVEGLKLRLPPRSEVTQDHVQIHSYCDQGSNGLTTLVHSHDGRVEVFESNVANLFDVSSRTDRFVSKALWTGHASSIRKIVRSNSGRSIVSRTDGNEGIVWRHTENKTGTTLVRQSVIIEKEYIHRICVIRQGSFVVYLHYGELTLWDTRHAHAKLVNRYSYDIPGKPLCVLLLPDTENRESIAHIATITSNRHGIVWELQLSQDTLEGTNGASESAIREFCRFKLGDADNLSNVLPVDPAGSNPVVSGFLDTFAKDVALSYSKSGLITSWTARIQHEDKSVEWLQTCSVDTGISDPALASGSSLRKAAVVNSTRSKLTIWDVKGAQLEYSRDYENQDVITDLDWTSTPDNQSVLAVGFKSRIVLLAQMRYDYLDKGPAWAKIREINIRDMTPHPIGDSTWLGGGNLVIGAGNQMFVYDKDVDHSVAVVANLGLPARKTAWDMFDVVNRLNGPLPVYHPQFLSQCTLSGKSTLVQRILLTLLKILKYHVEGEPIENQLDMDMESFYTSDDNNANSVAVSHTKGKSFGNFSSDDEDDEQTVTEAVATQLTEKLQQVALPSLTRQEQIHLVDIVECVATAEKQRRSMDDNAVRFALLFRQHVLRRGRSNEVNLSWREINWAYHSGSQDILIDLVVRHFQGKLLWQHARESGMFVWLTDLTTLVRDLPGSNASLTGGRKLNSKTLLAMNTRSPI